MTPRLADGPLSRPARWRHGALRSRALVVAAGCGRDALPGPGHGAQSQRSAGGVRTGILGPWWCAHRRLGWSFRDRDSSREAVQALAVQRGQPDAPPGLEQALEQLANGETEAAEAIFSEVLQRKTSEAETATREAAAAARHLGALAFLHDTQKALGYYRRAVELEPEEPEGWHQLGHLLSRIGELVEAAAAFVKVLELGESESDRPWVAVATGDLGIIYMTRGELDRAEELYRRALAIHKDLGRKEGMANACANLGVIYEARGNPEQARAYWRKARDLFAEIGARPRVEKVEGWLSTLETEVNEPRDP